MMEYTVKFHTSNSENLNDISVHVHDNPAGLGRPRSLCVQTKCDSRIQPGPQKPLYHYKNDDQCQA